MSQVNIRLDDTGFTAIESKGGWFVAGENLHTGAIHCDNGWTTDEVYAVVRIMFCESGEGHPDDRKIAEKRLENWPTECCPIP